MPKGSTCKALGCNSNKSDNPELSFHSFPKNKERFKLWCELLKRPDLKHTNVLANRMSMRVCSLHFEDRMYMSPFTNSRLIWCALPQPIEDDGSTSPPSTTDAVESVDIKALTAPELEKQERLTETKDDTAMKWSVPNDPSSPPAKSCKKFNWSLSLDEDIIIKEECCLEQEMESSQSSQCDLTEEVGEEEEEPCVDSKEGILRQHQSVNQDFSAEYSLFLSAEKPSSPESYCDEETVDLRDDTCSEGGNSPQKSPHKERSNSFKSSNSKLTSPKMGTNGQLSVALTVQKEKIINRTKILSTGKGAPQLLLPARVKRERSRSSEPPDDTADQLETDMDLVPPAATDTLDSIRLIPVSLALSNLPSVSVLHPNPTGPSPPDAIAQKSVVANSSASPDTLQDLCSENSSQDPVPILHSSPVSSEVKVSHPDEPNIASLTSMSLRSGRSNRQSSQSRVPKCAKNCQCEKCEEQNGQLVKVAHKSSLHRTYSGPIQRQTVKTKEGGRRTFMIVNKASLKNLQAKGLLQPLKKYGNKTLLSIENLIPAAQCKQILASLQQPSNTEQDSDLSSISGQTIQKIPALSEHKLKSLRQHIAVKNKSPPRCSPQTANQTPNQTANQTPNQTANQTPVVVSWSATNTTDTPSFTFTVQLPPGANQMPGSSQESQVPLQIVTPPVFIGGSHTTSSSQTSLLKQAGSPNSTKLRLPASRLQSKNSPQPTRVAPEIVSAVRMPLSVTQSTMSAVQKSRITSFTSTVPSVVSKNTTHSPIMSTKFPLVTQESCADGNMESSQSDSESIDDPEVCREEPSFEPTSPSGPVIEEGSSLTLGLATGPVKLRRGGVKMYRFVPGNEGKGEGSSRPKTNQKVRWVAMPSVPVIKTTLPSAPSGKPMQETQPSSIDLDVGKLLSDVSFIPPMYQTGKDQMKSANRDLKLKYVKLLNKHRQRYHILLKKYKALEEKISDFDDIGSPQQVIRDARRFLSEEHILFLESQMFLRNRSGTGNRFSKKFMNLMIDYYRRSAAGYRFLRSIFTIPSVKTVQKWISKPLSIREEDGDYLYIPMTRGESETGHTIDEVTNELRILDEVQNAQREVEANPNNPGISVAEQSDEDDDDIEEEEEEDGSSEEYDSEESAMEDVDGEEEEPMEEGTSALVTNIQEQNHQCNQVVVEEYEEEHW